jgi:hypothetical protein
MAKHRKRRYISLDFPLPEMPEEQAKHLSEQVYMVVAQVLHDNGQPLSDNFEVHLLETVASWSL